MRIPLLEIVKLQVQFHSLHGICQAVDNVSVSISQGETVGLVGESGCGKTVTALSVLRLIPVPPGKIVGGNIFLESTDLLKLSREGIRKIRGNSISMIFQEPTACLNPLFTIGDQISEVFMMHKGKRRREAWADAIEMCNKVKIPDPEKRVREYPHQLSGGMKQRVMIGMALSCSPKLLIADEPTTALDVTTQSQILDLLNEMKRDFNTSIMLITHNLGIVAEMATKIYVMYAGRIVEGGPAEEIFDNPMHPYTQGLLRASPYEKKRNELLPEIPGDVPSLYHIPKGCRFYPRCERRLAKCKEEPPTSEISEKHFATCWLLETGCV